MGTLIFILLILRICCSFVDGKVLLTNEVHAKQVLLQINEREIVRRNRAGIADWNYNLDISDDNLHLKGQVGSAIAKEIYEDWKLVSSFKWQDFEDYDLRRQFKFYAQLGSAALSDYKLNRNNELISKMQSLMQTATICDKYETKCNLSLEPELVEFMSTSRNEPELRHAWLEFRNTVGPKVKPYFPEYVAIQNEMAVLNNFSNMADYWIDSYETPDMKEQISQLWLELKPMYLQLHAYVRTQLRALYGEDVVSEKGPIPAHLLGNMWAQNWRNIAGDTLPFPEARNTDVTEEMVQQGYTVPKMFDMAENFFMSLNMSAMTDIFWQKSVFQKSKNHQMICHAMAYDFSYKDDFRIKICPRIDTNYFNVIHHEMGHVEYFVEYKNQPILYRTGANDGFHEAIGDTIAISVSSAKHKYKIGLSHSKFNHEHTQINEMYQLAMDKIGFLPFGLLVDLWRWEVFQSKITPITYNCRWWELREKYQGLEPPVDRTSADFDASAKFHVVASVPFLRYFVANILQFQFHRTLCQIAGEYVVGDPNKSLHNCDIYESVAAGNALKKMLSMGMSRPWMDALETLTGKRNMDTTAMLDYFRPLYEWLKTTNAVNGAFIGWEPSLKRASCDTE